MNFETAAGLSQRSVDSYQQSLEQWADYAGDKKFSQFFGKYFAEKASALKAQSFDRSAIAGRGLQYERLDQLTNELLLGVR